MRAWRRLVLLAHVLTSVAWMTSALALFALLALGAAGDDPAQTRAAASMAHHLDGVLLAPMANSSLFTGLVLALGTAWGLVAHRWVLIKFAITVAQLHVGILLLSGWLNETAARGAPASAAQLAATLIMAGLIALQAWLSLAKPGGRTRFARTGARGRPAKLPTAPRWVFVLAVVAVAVDPPLGVVMGHPTPVAQLTVLVVVCVLRRRALAADPVG